MLYFLPGCKNKIGPNKPGKSRCALQISDGVGTLTTEHSLGLNTLTGQAGHGLLAGRCPAPVRCAEAARV